MDAGISAHFLVYADFTFVVILVSMLPHRSLPGPHCLFPALHCGQAHSFPTDALPVQMLLNGTHHRCLYRIFGCTLTLMSGFTTGAAAT